MKAGPSSSSKVPSTEVYRIARQVVGPWLKANGFRRETAFASWTRPVAGRHVTMWFQVSQDGWDPLAGSTFVVEFQRSDRPEVGYGRLRARVVELLDPVGREEVRAIRNAVAARLRRPSLAEVRARFGFEPPADMLERYVAAFAPRLAPYAPDEDVWLPYASEVDVRIWCRFVADKLPALTARFEALPDPPPARARMPRTGGTR